ncbi:OSGEP threonylcarbamoyltransferase, partial [Bombycilla garrulus]|nr:OSGEP threonylcarbamoyltransferase [Bombycilla garrulus]
LGLVRTALREAGVEPRELDGIAFTKGPGMGSPLAVVAAVARTLAQLWGCPLLAVNHCVGHIEMGRLLGPAPDPLVLYVSGGNTQVIAYARRRYRILGETLDVAVGNCIDRLARLLPSEPQKPPNSPQIPLRGRRLVPLPYVVKGLDVSFSGLLSHLQVSQNPKIPGNGPKIPVGSPRCSGPQVCPVQPMGGQQGTPQNPPGGRYCIDNGAMIAQAGWEMLRVGQVTELSQSGITQRYRTDEVEVTWRD